MQADRWSAGAALMEDGNPDAWRGLMNDSKLVKVNRAAVAACRDAAAKMKRTVLRPRRAGAVRGRNFSILDH